MDGYYKNCRIHCLYSYSHTKTIKDVADNKTNIYKRKQHSYCLFAILIISLSEIKVRFKEGGKVKDLN